jgi:hypothetical protein
MLCVERAKENGGDVSGQTPFRRHRARRPTLLVRSSCDRPPLPLFLFHPSFLNTFFMAAITQFPMPPATADLATTWAFLEEGVDHIMTKLHTGVSYTKYMNLYTVSYNYCTSSKMHSTTSSEQSVAGRCLSLFTSRPPFADIPCSWCQPDGFRFIQ